MPKAVPAVAFGPLLFSLPTIEQDQSAPMGAQPVFPAYQVASRVAPAGLDNQRRSGIQHRELSAPRQGLPIEISNSHRGAWMARRPPRKAEIKDAIATALRRQRGNAGAVETRGPGTEFRYGKVGVLAVVSNFQSLSNCHYAGVLVEPKNWSGVVGGSRPPAWMNTAQCLFRFRA